MLQIIYPENFSNLYGILFSFPVVCMCLCVPICVGMFVCRHSYIGVCMRCKWKSLSSSSTLFFKVSQSNPELTDMASFASQLALRSPCILSEAGIRGRLPCLPGIYMGSNDPDCSPQMNH